MKLLIIGRLFYMQRKGDADVLYKTNCENRSTATIKQTTTSGA